MQTDPGRRPRRRALFVQVQVLDHAELYVHKARNVSTGGMFLDAPLPLPAGTRIDLAFDLPGVGEVSCEAEVRWNTDAAPAGLKVPHPGMGVVFVDATASHVELLRRYVDGR